jgi:uncharacterized protein involved in response to NO
MFHQIQEPTVPKFSWQAFTAAPHRVFFFSGALQLLLPLLFWFIELGSRYTGWWQPPHVLIPPTFLHAFVMQYGVFIFFMYGFLMTTYPRWMNGQIIPRERYLGAFAWLSAGMALFEAGVFFNLSIAATGLMIFLVGWLLGMHALYQVYRTAPAKNKSYETWLNIALASGWMGAASFLWWLISDDMSFAFYSFRAGLWLFLLPVLITVAHRMLPFFSSSIIRPYTIVQPRWTLPLMAVGCVTHFVLEMNYLAQWLFVADMPLALLGFYHSYKWQFKNSFADRLLAVLHVAFLWVGIGMTLLSAQSLHLLITGEMIFSRGPLHALTIGFVSTLLIAMASRVTLGHSGRPLALNTLSWLLFWGLNLTAVLRILAEIPATENILGVHFNIIAAGLWLVCMGAWVSKYGPMYLKTRLDNKPG